MARCSLAALLTLILVTGSAVGLTACGGSDNGASQQEIDQAKREAAAQQKLKDKQAQLEKELHDLKKQTNKNSGSSGSKSNGGSSSSGSSTSTTSGASCGAGVTAGANTSCAFALNVAQAYFDAGGGSPTVSVYSPVTTQNYTMNCTAGAPTVCRGGNNAVVYIR